MVSKQEKSKNCAKNNIEETISASNLQTPPHFIASSSAETEKCKKKILDAYAVEGIAQRAIDAAGFGKFNIKIAAVGALIYFNTALSIMSTGFVLTAAACDFKMTTIYKGYIVTAPLLGSCFGPLVWGLLADLKGRRMSLITALFMQGASELLMSFIPNYWCFLFLKFLSGFASIGELSLLFTYVGEFQTTKYRKLVLSFMDGPMIVGMITVPVLAWLIVPLEFDFRNEYIHFRSWNLFVMLCSIPAVLIAFWLIFLPETPKFLAESGQNFQFLTVLGDIYVKNSNQPVETYFEKLANGENKDVSDFVHRFWKTPVNQKKISKKEITLRQILKDFKKQALDVSKPPYVLKTALASISTFFITSSHYALLLWFPEIFQRFSQFETKFQNETSSVCSVSKKLYSLNATMANTNIDLFGCESKIDTRVYLNSLWQAIACIPFSILLPMSVDRLGFKFFVVASTLIAFATTLGFFFTTNSLQNLILSCIFEVMTSVFMSSMFCFLVVIFPTNVRVVASTVIVIFSRLGSLLGNTVFSYLIDDNCVPLICIVAVQLFIGAVFALIIQIRRPKIYETV
ncbi:synaptic vesicle glycoprotein 2B-like [Belonocnema kinseyi]|uniref:synaptic vesicle glycoprotein 2B-like n=1 Tax=Belonocnema kinseyi TaxID=2817044 RepID=UPI00143DA835|nr:synaptic vesicle glycoprotein 2B-like [Belonocnema kinseyi]